MFIDLYSFIIVYRNVLRRITSQILLKSIEEATKLRFLALSLGDFFPNEDYVILLISALSIL